MLKTSQMASAFCILGIFVMTGLIFSFSLYPLSRSTVYASPFEIPDNSLSGQQSDQTAGEGQQLNEGNQSQRIILEYANPNMGISLGYPENWDVDNLLFDRERAVSFYVYQGPDDLYGESVNVQVNASGEPDYFRSPDMSLDDIAQQLVSSLQNTWADFQHISTEPGQVAGVPALAIHYTYSDPGIGQTEAMEVIVKGGDRLYDFLYIAKPSFFNVELGTFRNMIDSAQIAQPLSQQQPPPSPSSQQSQSREAQQQSNIEVSIPPGSAELTDTAFQPNPVQINVGDTVTWTNDDSQPHTVTSGANGAPDGKFDSSPDFNPLLAPGQTFEHTFTEADDYPYFCMLHPNQVGTVSVS
jgi:plastocyanin